MSDTARSGAAEVLPVVGDSAARLSLSVSVPKNWREMRQISPQKWHIERAPSSVKKTQTKNKMTTPWPKGPRGGQISTC